jgi:hypothetical protein
MLNNAVGILSIIWLLLRIDNSRTDIVIRYRPERGFVGAYTWAGTNQFYAFIGFILLTLVFAAIMTPKLYKASRNFGVGLQLITMVLLVFTVVVGNALISLR